MIVEKNKVVSIDYVLTDDNDDVLDSTQGRGPMEYVHGAGSVLPALEESLAGKSTKGRLRITLPPDQGYGEYSEELVQSIPLSTFPNADAIRVGVQFQLDTSQGPKIATITKIEGDEFTLDMNHPLAGKTLHFDVEVANIRDATAEEIENGHVHQEGCGCGHAHNEEDCGCGHSHKDSCGCGHSH